MTTIKPTSTAITLSMVFHGWVVVNSQIGGHAAASRANSSHSEWLLDSVQSVTSIHGTTAGLLFLSFVIVMASKDKVKTE